MCKVFSKYNKKKIPLVKGLYICISQVIIYLPFIAQHYKVAKGVQNIAHGGQTGSIKDVTVCLAAGCPGVNKHDVVVRIGQNLLNRK